MQKVPLRRDLPSGVEIVVVAVVVVVVVGAIGLPSDAVYFRRAVLAMIETTSDSLGGNHGLAIVGRRVGTVPYVGVVASEMALSANVLRASSAVVASTESSAVAASWEREFATSATGPALGGGDLYSTGATSLRHATRVRCAPELVHQARHS